MSDVIRDLTPFLDPEIAPLFARQDAVDYAAVKDWPKARATRHVEPRPSSESVVIENVVVPAYPETEMHQAAVRAYLPASGAAENTLLWIHGGGFVGGHVNENDAMCMTLVDAVGCNLVAAAYRLAPEHPFPAATNDCFAALQWIGSGPALLGGVPQRLAVAGGSAGGCLAAAMALMARDLGGPELCHQILVFPVLDDRLETRSARVIEDQRTWSRKKASFGWKAYLGDDHGNNDVSPYAAPARAESLAGLPPATIFVEELDLLRDEAVDYANRLTAANVRAGLTIYPGTHHGHTGLAPQAQVSRRTSRDVVDAIKTAFQTPIFP
ncbi:MAG: alpha/beta hydrolase [Pseudomonadota bacterium]